MEEYVASGRSAAWFVSQVVSIVRRRGSHLTMSEKGAEMLSNVRNDTRYALRTLGRNPGFAVAAIVPIALGIGINTGGLFAPQQRRLAVAAGAGPRRARERLSGLPRRAAADGVGARSLFSIPEYRAYRDEAHTLSGLMAYSRERTVTLGREAPQEIDGILVTCNYFDVLACRRPSAPASRRRTVGRPARRPSWS